MSFAPNGLITNLASGTYLVGLAGYTQQTPNEWSASQGGNTSAIAFNSGG